MQRFDPSRLTDLSVALGVAFLLGTMIGAERQYRQRSAGLRTNVLVAVGAAAFVSVGASLNANIGAVQITAYIVSGVGFLGAGVIMKDGGSVSGLNTAATLWCSAAVGTLAGIGLPAEAVVVALAVLAGNTMLRPLVDAINRAPVNERTSEATYEVHVLTAPAHVGEMREQLIEALENANYPVREVEVSERSDEVTELAATLVSTAVEPSELDAVIAALEASPMASHASWSSTAED